MMGELAEKITTLLAQFSTDSRQYSMTVGDGSDELGSAACWWKHLAPTTRCRYCWT
jgi:hypothetical protein